MSAVAWSLGEIEQDRQRLIAIVSYWCPDAKVREEALGRIDHLASQAAHSWRKIYEEETGKT